MRKSSPPSELSTHTPLSTRLASRTPYRGQSGLCARLGIQKRHDHTGVLGAGAEGEEEGAERGEEGREVWVWEVVALPPKLDFFFLKKTNKVDK